MRVAINGRFLAQQVTGVQRHARELVRALDAELTHDRAATDGLDLSLLVPPDGAMNLDLHSIRVRRVGRLRGHLWEQVELPIHVRGQLLLSLTNSAPLLTRHQIVTMHDASVYAVPETYSAAYRRWYRFLFPRLGRRAALVLTVSEFSRSELALRAGIPGQRIRVVPAGHEHILEAQADPAVLDRYGLAGRRYVLAVSSRARHKNLQAIADAIELLGTRDWVYVLAGGSNLRTFGDQSRAWPDNVVCPGYVTDGELRALYQHAACLVFPSFYEGFGHPPLEAMACGCPVIVARAASLPEVCGDAALYVDPADPKSLAAALERVLGDASLGEDLRRRGHDRAQRFSWKRAARQVLDILRQESAR